MSFPFSENTLVKDIVNELPKSSDLFKKHRIDFCCGGNIPLANAAEERGLDPKTIVAELQTLFTASEPNENEMEEWIHSDTRSLIEHIVLAYHRPLEEELAMLSPYVTKVARVHGENHPELLKVYELFYAFKKEMLEHTAKEEETVFPLIQQLNDGTAPNREEAINAIVELEKEHDAAGAILKELRDVTADYELPFDACGTYRLVYKRLEALEEQTFMHVHLENNILFPRYTN
ncbi:iron-sulfur cluster repair di-iron protein [Neobacillus sp. SM06]|uniref:iron-sulfur cluster repair di-iron protein n=1 Tax=Neobacillus sp. SM06 TaxID=3422492 RepID=UPI003D2CF2F8